MNKIWWLFCLLAAVAVLFNPYAVIDAFAFLMIIIVNAIYLNMGKFGKRFKHTGTPQEYIMKAHTYVFWIWGAFDILTFFMLVYVMYMQTYSPGASPMFIPYGTQQTVLLSFVATIFLHAVGTILLVRRLHDVFWKNR